MIAAAPQLQSAIFENDGEIVANNGGSMLIQANSLRLGLALTNATNYLFADGNVGSSAASIAGQQFDDYRRFGVRRHRLPSMPPSS